MPSYVIDGAGAPGKGSIYDPEKARAKMLRNGKHHRIWRNNPKRSKGEIEAERAEIAQKRIARMKRQEAAKQASNARLQAHARVPAHKQAAWRIWMEEGQARIDAADKARVEAHRKAQEAAAGRPEN